MYLSRKGHRQKQEGEQGDEEPGEVWGRNKPPVSFSSYPRQSVKSVSQSVSIHTFHDGGGA